MTAINTIHNLPLDECKQALREIQRVSRGQSFIVVDAWTDDEERRPDEGLGRHGQDHHARGRLEGGFDEAGYTGDYYWFIVA